MKIVESHVRRLEISEVQGLDSIRVMLEDLAPGQGRINIECCGQSWANYWGGMGKKTIAKFFTTCGEHYLAGKLSSIPPSVFDPCGLKDALKREVITERRKGLISGEFARERFSTIEDLDIPETVDGCWSISEIMTELLGEEWWYRLPEKENPDYAYLCRIIKTVQAALREVEA